MRDNGFPYEYEVGGFQAGAGAAEWMHAAGVDRDVHARPGDAQDWPSDGVQA